jgi:hypothetical protein
MTDIVPGTPASVRWMRILVVVVLIGMACYTGFMMLERTGASTSTRRAAVTGKRHMPAHRTYVTEIIRGRSMVVPREVADAYVVDLALTDGRASGVVAQDLYDRLSVGDSVTAQVRRRRLSRAIDVLEISR